jgi:hypothetical protein
MKNIVFKPYLAFMVLAPYLAFTPLPAYSDPEVPSKPPVTATSFIVCSEHGPQLVSMIVTYADGSVLRIDLDQMHGFTTPQQIMAYGETAQDKYGYYVKCKGEVST